MPHTPRTPAPRSSLRTWDNSSPSTSLRKSLAGSQKRRRGRTALTLSWHSALDNQLHEGRIILILCIASDHNQRGMERITHATIAVSVTANIGSRFKLIKIMLNNTLALQN